MDFIKQRIFNDSIKHLKDVNFFHAVDAYCLDCDDLDEENCCICPIRKACNDRYKKWHNNFLYNNPTKIK